MDFGFIFSLLLWYVLSSLSLLAFRGWTISNVCNGFLSGWLMSLDDTILGVKTP
jgi:hypothetical protein